MAGDTSKAEASRATRNPGRSPPGPPPTSSAESLTSPADKGKDVHVLSAPAIGRVLVHAYQRRRLQRQSRIRVQARNLVGLGNEEGNDAASMMPDCQPMFIAAHERGFRRGGKGDPQLRQMPANRKVYGHGGYASSQVSDELRAAAFPEPGQGPPAKGNARIRQIWCVLQVNKITGRDHATAAEDRGPIVCSSFLLSRPTPMKAKHSRIRRMLGQPKRVPNPP